MHSLSLSVPDCCYFHAVPVCLRVPHLRPEPSRAELSRRRVSVSPRPAPAPRSYFGVSGCRSPSPSSSTLGKSRFLRPPGSDHAPHALQSWGAGEAPRGSGERGGVGGTQAGAPQWPRRALMRSPARPASAVAVATRRDVISRPGSASLVDVMDPSACFHAPAAGGAPGGWWLLPQGWNFFARGSDPFSLGPQRLPLFHNLSFEVVVSMSAFLRLPTLSTQRLLPNLCLLAGFSLQCVYLQINTVESV